MGKILAVDFGLRRVGLAISDERQSFAFPRPTLKVSHWREAVARIGELCSEEDIERIVVGQPISLAGIQTKRSDLECFIDALSELTKQPIDTIDERLTSRQAERELAGLSSTRSKGDVDRLSAVIILENYLEYIRGRQ